MKKNKQTKDATEEIKDFFDKVSGKKEFNFFEEIFSNQSTTYKKQKEKKRISKDLSDFDSPEDFAEEYADEFEDEEEAMEDYEENY